MNAGETWGDYMGRLASLLPDGIRIVSGQYVGDITEMQCLGERFLQGEGFLSHAQSVSGHYFQLVLL